MSEAAAEVSVETGAPERVPLSRREFLNYLWAMSMAVAMAGSGGLAIWFLVPRFREGEFGEIVQTVWIRTDRKNEIGALVQMDATTAKTEATLAKWAERKNLSELERAIQVQKVVDEHIERGWKEIKREDLEG